MENVKRCVFLVKGKRKLNGDNMRKVGIITIPDYNNYGNRLQNYAVKKYFENKGFKVETLEMNDKSFGQRKARKIKLYLKKAHLTFLIFLFKVFSKGKNSAFRYLQFEKFTRKYLNVKYIPQWEDAVVTKIGNEYSYIVLDTVDKSVVLWYNEEKRTGVFLHGEQLSTARYVRCDVGNSQAVHNRKQGNVGRERKGYPSISEWRVLDFENGSTMERPAAGIW